jgi:hypothetical protein
MKKPGEFFYKEVINLGFKRIGENDSVFFDQNGYEWFRVEMKLKKNLYLDWDCESHEVHLVKWKSKDGSIKNKIQLKTIREIKNIIQIKFL